MSTANEDPKGRRRGYRDSKRGSSGKSERRERRERTRSRDSGEEVVGDIGRSERKHRLSREAKEAKERARRNRSSDSSTIERGSLSKSERIEQRNRSSDSSTTERGSLSKSERIERRERTRSRDSGEEVVGDIGRSERRERRAREDKEAKARAKRSRSSDEVLLADTARSERRDRRAREDKEAKARAKRSRSSDEVLLVDNERSARRDREDREAKDRARILRSGGGSSRSFRVRSGDRSDRSGLSSSRHHNERRDRDAKAKSRGGSRAVRPGVETVASIPRSKSGRGDRRRSKEKEKMNEVSVASNKNNDEDEFAVEAIKIDEDSEANERARKQDEENEKLRQQMLEMAERQQAAEKRAQREKQVAKKRQKRMILWAVLIFILLAGVGVAVYFLTRPSAEEPPLPGTTEAPTPTSPSSLNTTAAPTSDLSSNNPTDAPTVALLFDPPTDADCAAMKNGDAVLNQDDMKEYTFAVGIDVSFSLDVDFETAYLPDLEKAIQEYLPPALAQCPGVTRRRLRSGDPNRFVVGNAAISAEHNKDESCKAENSNAACYRLAVTLRVWLKDDIDKGILTITTFVAEAFDRGPTRPSIVELLKLTTPYVGVALISAEGLDPTNAPTQSPSTVPTATMVPSRTPTSSPSRAPVIGPTTEQPTDIPSSGPTTQLPSSSPTFSPTGATPSPVVAPTKFPTPNPTPNPTVKAASGLPTVTDSNRPTKVPSLAPSENPSESPSVAPSQQPSGKPSLSPSTVPSGKPSLSPSKVPSVVPSQQPSGKPSPWPSAVPSRTPSTQPSTAPSWLSYPITFPVDSTFKKYGPGNTGCFISGSGCYSEVCADLDPFPSAEFTYFTDTTASPVSGFDWVTNPVWSLALITRGWDCSANHCADTDDCCWDDPLMGGAQLDLTGTPFVFHADTRIKSNGYATKTRILIDGTPVLHFYNPQEQLLGVTGGKVLTMNAGGLCGNADVYYKVTLG